MVTVQLRDRFVPQVILFDHSGNFGSKMTK